jgi:hypothetical protein
VNVLLIFMANGQSIQTASNGAADLAGLVNAGEEKIYACTDHITGQPVFLVVDQITQFQDIHVDH